MKRISITIQNKNNPENIVTGYALSHEILEDQVSFFAAQKFPVDEDLIISFMVNNEKKSLLVTMKHMHEQISSGRVMNALPTEENPFPARKFFRCYSFVPESQVSTGLSEVTNIFEAENSAPSEIPVAGDVPPAEIEEQKAA